MVMGSLMGAVPELGLSCPTGLPCWIPSAPLTQLPQAHPGGPALPQRHLRQTLRIEQLSESTDGLKWS